MNGIRLEDRIITEVRSSADELVALVQQLVAFDTTARAVGDPARDEEALQRLLAERLRGVGAEIDLWEPESTGKGNRLVPDDLDFVGRPQLAARVPGLGGGRSLLLNGHIDVVPPGPRKDWTVDPFRAEVQDGMLIGRGVGDMKGGVAACCFAIEILSRLGVHLDGDVLFCTDTDEETSGAGSLACVEHGVKADAGICAEHSGFDAWTSSRGTMWPYVIVPGRAGHAEMPHPHWRDGGAVNAIEKAQVVIDAVRRLREEWRTRSDQQHPHLDPSDVVPTMIEGGIFPLTYPPSCKIIFDVSYLPSMVGASGTGEEVEHELRRWVQAAAGADPWLSENELTWGILGDTVAAEMEENHPLVGITLMSGAQLGHPGKVSGLNSWHDASHFTAKANTPTFSYGPRGLESAHAPDERVSVDELVDYCAIVALAATRYCSSALDAATV